MSCKDRIKRRCNTVYASCVEYQGELPTFTTIEEDCVDMQEVAEDIYEIIADIKSEIDLSNLDKDCLELPTTPTVKNTIQTLIDFICLQQGTIDTLQSAVTLLQSYTGSDNCGEGVSNSFGTNILNTTARTVTGNTTFNTPSNKLAGVYTLATLEDLPKLNSNFANDAAAAVGGVVVGGLYHTAGIIKIRIS